MKISVLYLGKMIFPKDYLVRCSDLKELINSPVSAILIQHPVLGNVLYDVGNTPFHKSQYPKHIQETYPTEEFISIEDSLIEKGLTVNDIDLIIISHMHFDHIGGLKYFQNTKAIKKVLVAETELKNAFHQVMTGENGAYVKDLIDFENLQYETISEDIKLCDDVELFIQKSHTPGVIGLKLHTKNEGTIIVTSDTVYTRESYNLEIAPGGKINKTEQEFYDNLNMIKIMQEEYNGTVFYGHDYEQVVSWSKRIIE